MTKLTVTFSRAKGFAPLSWLIMLCERTRFSHASISLYSTSLDRVLVYQATGSGVYFIGKDAFSQKHSVVEEFGFEVTDEERKNLLRWAIDQSGKPYGKLQILGLAFKRFLKLFGLNVLNPFKNKSRAYVCTELVYESLVWVGEVAAPLAQDDVGLRELLSVVKKAELSQDIIDG